jgi:dolichol-phosphate mannosyltransferase
MVQWLGFRSAEIAFTPDARKAGHSKYTLRRMLRLAGDGLFSFSRAPLRLAGYLGLLAVGVGLGHSAWYALQVVRGAARPPLEWEYLLLVTHLLGGAILAALGFLGEYVGRIYEQVKGRPIYVLKDQSPRVAARPQREQREAA